MEPTCDAAAVPSTSTTNSRRFASTRYAREGMVSAWRQQRPRGCETAPDEAFYPGGRHPKRGITCSTRGSRSPWRGARRPAETTRLTPHALAAPHPLSELDNAAIVLVSVTEEWSRRPLWGSDSEVRARNWAVRCTHKNRLGNSVADETLAGAKPLMLVRRLLLG
jgi:hypothetical protein